MAQPVSSADRRRIARLTRALEDARACLIDVAAKLDFPNVGQSKRRLIQCADRCAKALSENNNAQ